MPFRPRRLNISSDTAFTGQRPICSTNFLAQVQSRVRFIKRFGYAREVDFTYRKKGAVFDKCKAFLRDAVCCSVGGKMIAERWPMGSKNGL